MCAETECTPAMLLFQRRRPDDEGLDLLRLEIGPALSSESVLIIVPQSSGRLKQRQGTRIVTS